jgi:decaprenylphospho-beta-D-erythro-pentofuranosid-2-ulose 2-reductase
MTNILVLGAGSAIAQELARQELLEGAKVFLAARSPGKLEPLLALARERGLAGNLEVACFDAMDTDPEVLLRNAESFLGEIHVALLAWGSYRDQKLCQEDFAAARPEIEENFTSQVRWLNALAPRFERRRGGTIAVISSVAGDRGRQSNYVYGAAKAGLNAYLEGLRHRLWPCGVNVLTIKPGFVDTPMTAHLAKGPLFASPAKVAGDIRRAIKTGRRELYTPWFWRWILWLVRRAPGPIFYRTKL